MKMNKNKGFTLIELMIIVAILGILLAVAAPAWEKYQNKSKGINNVSTIPAAPISVGTPKMKSVTEEQQLILVKSSFERFVSKVYGEQVSAYCEESDEDRDKRINCSSMVNVNGVKQSVKAACLISGGGCTEF
jgi:prepilin-type N-terminal cleavage/methylation domain-containing protein